MSGSIRDFAYKFSEGRLMRWIALLFADRVNVVEGLVSDLAHGHVPNIPKEMGWKSEMKHNPVGFATKAVVTGVCVAAVIALIKAKRR